MYVFNFINIICMCYPLALIVLELRPRKKITKKKDLTKGEGIS